MVIMYLKVPDLMGILCWCQDIHSKFWGVERLSFQQLTKNDCGVICTKIATFLSLGDYFKITV